MANKISLVFEAIGADKLAQVFGQVSGAAEKAGASAEKASAGTQAAGQAAGTATKNVDLLGLSLNKMSGLAGQAGVDLGVFRQALQGAHESMSMLAGGFSAGTAAAGAFVVGVAGITGALVATSQHLVSSYNEIKTFAAVSGMAAGDADDLADAMQAVGVSSQQLSMALFKLEDDAASGGEALLKLGLTMDDLKTKSSGELFVATIDKIQALGSQSEKTAALVEVFGARLGRAFAELVREGGMSIDQLKAKVADLSPWTKEMETNARNLAVAQTFLGNAIGGVVDMLGNAFAPILTSAINTMTEWAVAIRKGVENSGVLGTSINMLVSVFGALWEAIQPLMPLLIELGKAAVAVGLAMITGFQGVMIPVVALTGALGALWESLQKVLAGDFSGALTALTTGLARTEEATQRQIARFNEQVAANEKVAASLNGVTTATTATGAAAERTAPSIRKVGDDSKKAADAAKTAAETFAQMGQKLTAIAGSFESTNTQQLAAVFNEFEAAARKVEALGPGFAAMAQQIREMGAAAVSLTAGQQALKAYGEELDNIAKAEGILTKLQASIDAIHMTEAQRELAGFAAELANIQGLAPDVAARVMTVAETLITVRDAAKEGKKELEDAAKYMKGLEAAATTAAAPLENLGQYVGDLAPAAASAAEATAILTDRIERLMPVNSIASITQYNDALREAGVTAADSAVTFDILNDRVSEAGATSIKSEQAWEEFGAGVKGTFLSVTDTFTKMATGMIQGTLSIGDAFTGLGQSLLTNFTQMVMHKVFDPILEKAASFVADLIQTFLSADWGSVAASWGQALGGIFSQVFGGGGSSSGFSGGGDWWDDIGLEALAHGGTIARSGPFILHAGETVIPAGMSSGGQSGRFMPRPGGGYGGTVPVRVENVDAFGQQFGTWAGRVISATPLALQGIGMLTGNAAIGGAGSGLGIMGAARTAYGLYQGGYMPGDYLSPQSIGSLASGAGSIMSLVGGLTGIQGLSYAGMGIQGAVLATQIVSSLVPQVASAITGAGATIASSIGGSVGSWAGGAVGGLAGLPSLATMVGPGAVMAIPAIASFLASMGMEELARQDIVRREQGQVYGGDMAARAGTIRTMADLDVKYKDAVFGERTPRQDVTMLATWAMVGAEQANQAIITMQQYATDMGANVDDLTAMEQANMDRMNAFVSKAAEIGVTPDMALLNVSPHTVSAGHGVQSPENIGPLMDVWTEIINRITSGTQAVADGSQDVADASEQQSTATRSVVQNQADLIMKYGDTTERLRTLGEAFDIDLGIPKLMELTTAQLEFLGTATGAQIETMIAGWQASLTEGITQQVMEDPVKLLGLLDLESLKEEGETIEETAQRVGEGLLQLGAVMQQVDQEIAMIGQGELAAATFSFNTAIEGINESVSDASEQFEEAAIRWDASSGLIGDPAAMAEAAATAHDALIARYEAEIALIQAITAAIGSLYDGANALVGMAARLEELGIKIPGAGEFAQWLTELGTGQVGGFATVEQNLLAGGGAVGLFAQQSMMAATAMDLPGLESAMTSAGNLVAGFTATIDQINQIGDPSVRMRLLTEVLGQVGGAAEAAARAAITYWTTLHNTVSGMIGQLNTIASSIASAGNSIAKNAPWLKAAGVDVSGLAKDMLGLIELFPTMGAKLELLGTGVQMFIAGMSDSQMREARTTAIQFNQAQPGSAARADFATQITTAFQPILTGFVQTFTAAMALQDPAQRSSALTTLMETIGSFLGSLPPELAAALTTIFGPEIQILVGAMTTSAAQQAASAAAIKTQLMTIIGPSGALSPENFLLMTVQGIQQSLALIVQGAGPLFAQIATGMVTAGGEISTAIGVAGEALSGALGQFKAPADQLTSALNQLSTSIEGKVRSGVEAGVRGALAGGVPSRQSGGEIPETGLYMLHEGEGVLTKAQNEALHHGSLQILGSYQSGTIQPGPSGPQPKQTLVPGYNPEWQAYMAAREAEQQASLRSAMAALLAEQATTGATDAQHDYTAAINEAADALSSNADLLDNTAIDFGRLALAMAGLSTMYVDLGQKTNAAMAGMRLWAIEIGRTNDVMGQLIGGGPVVIGVINGFVDAAFKLTDADPETKLRGLTSAFNTVAQMATTAQEAVRKSFDRQRQALEETNRARENAISDEQDAIRDQIDALRELEQATTDWVAVAKSVADTIFNLQQGAMAPPDAAMQLARAQTEFQGALGAYRAAPSAEGAQEVQGLASAVLEAAAQMFTKPSPEYAALFDSVIASLEDVRASAESRIGTSEDYLSQITALEEQSKALDEERNLLQKDLNAKMDMLAAREEEAVNIIGQAIAPTMERLAIEMERVAALTSVQSASASSSSSTLATVENLLAQGLTIHESMDGSMVLVSNLLGQIVGYLSGGRVIMYPRPGYTGPGWAEQEQWPTAQGGAWSTHAGLYNIHPGEMILPASVASTVRAEANGMTSDPTIGGPVTINVAIQGDNPQQIWQELRPLLDDYIRPSQRGGVIMRGQNRRRRGR